MQITNNKNWFTIGSYLKYNFIRQTVKALPSGYSAVEYSDGCIYYLFFINLSHFGKSLLS